MLAQSRSSNFLLLAMISAGMAFLAFEMFAAIAPSIHPSITHGADTDQARNCFNNYGPARAFQQQDGTFHLLCSSPDKRSWFDVIVGKDPDGSWFEKTSFTPKDGQLNSILKWLSSKNVKAITDLSKFSGLKFPY